MRALLLVLALCLLSAPAFAQGPGLTLPNRNSQRPPAPGEGGPAVLPAGFQELRWGASEEILQVLRGPLEERPAFEDSVSVFIEAAAPGEPPKNIVHYTVWQDRLVQLQIFYQDKLVGAEALAFIARLEETYGTANHTSRRGPAGRDGSEGALLEESWAWQDPFTNQVLLRDPKTNEWSLLRQSRVLQELRAATAAKARDQSSDDKVNSLPID